MDRYPAVAGQFYPATEDELRRMVLEMVPPATDRVHALGAVAPHAGYIYSGAIAGKVFASIEPAELVVILGPNHHGYGHPLAVYPGGEWHTPLGGVTIDKELAADIVRSFSDADADIQAHRFEHSLEVMVPFLQICAPSAQIVPICLGDLSLDRLLDFGSALGDILSRQKKKVLVLASSDMTHYESDVSARAKDMAALDRLLALDPEGLYRIVRQERITMCGVRPVVAMLEAAKRLGAKSAKLIDYGNSGDVTGDHEQVVGYAGATVC